MKLKKMLLALTTILSLSFATSCNQERGTSPSTVENPKANMSYEFKGDEKAKAGFAQGTITITPIEGAANSGYYLLYYANDMGLLQEYDELASIKITGEEVKFEVKDGLMIPEAATKIYAFESETRFLDLQPEISSAVSVVDIPVSKRLKLDTPELTFGAISDVHMNYEYYNFGAYAKWKTALNIYARQEMDYVFVTGDLTGDGETNITLEQEYQQYVKIIEESNYQGERIYEAIGNHGNTPATVPLFVEYTSGEGEIHPFEGSPYFSVMIEGKTSEVKDNLFIIMAQELQAPGDSAKYDNFSKTQIDWVEGLLKEYGKKENVNIFLIEHSPFLDFGPGDRHYGGYRALVTFNENFTQTMRLKTLLTEYKDVVMMSGHTHLSLYDNENYSDENDSFCRMIHLGSGSQPSSYGEKNTFTRNTDGRYLADTKYGSEGYIVKVYKDYIVYTGYNFSTGCVIPASCILLPIKAYGGSGNQTESNPVDDNLFKGAGTKEDPYQISTPEHFEILTNKFNASISGIEAEMYGHNKYFIQTADIDMSNIEGYQGTTANGNSKCFFAGNYDGNGHILKVNINASGQRSVFPYSYGTISNLCIQGNITGTETAQVVRTLYGNIINCLFDVNLNAPLTNGIAYSIYKTNGKGYIYNVYTTGTMNGETLNPVASNDSTNHYYNVFHYYTTLENSLINDAVGIQSKDLTMIIEAFNNHNSTEYNTIIEFVINKRLYAVENVNNKLCFVK